MALSDTRGSLTGSPAAGSRRFRLSSISPTSRYYWIRLLLENPAARLSLIYIGLVVVVAALAPVVAPFDPTFVNPVDRLQGPSSDYWFGTDDLGRDVFSRAIIARRDFPVIQGAVMTIAAIYVFANLLVDILYVWVDPRVRYGSE